MVKVRFGVRVKGTHRLFGILAYSPYPPELDAVTLSDAPTASLA